MGLLTKDAIVQVEDLPRISVPVPEWGGEVMVRGTMSYEQDEYDDSLTRLEIGQDGKAQVKANTGNARARLVVKCLVDADGKKLFPNEAEAINILGKKSTKVIDRLYAIIQDLSGTAKKAVKDAEKNSDAIQSASSPSA